MKRCAKCKGVHYCCKECQIQDWTKHKGNCKTLLKQLEESEFHFREAIKCRPNYAVAKAELAMLLYEKFDRFQEALDLMTQAVFDMMPNDKEKANKYKYQFVPEIMEKMGNDIADIAIYLCDKFQDYEAALKIVREGLRSDKAPRKLLLAQKLKGAAKHITEKQLKHKSANKSSK